MRFPARWTACSLLVLTVMGASGCREARQDGTEDATPLVDVPATVRRFPLDSDTFVLVAEDSLGSRYLPDELPVPFRHDGLAVVFSGRIGPIPANVRLIGTPVTLTRIRPRDGAGFY